MNGQCSNARNIIFVFCFFSLVIVALLLSCFCILQLIYCTWLGEMLLQIGIYVYIHLESTIIKYNKYVF